MPRFYRYLIYRTYAYFLRTDKYVPVASTEAMMCTPHAFHIMLVYAVLVHYFPAVDFTLSKITIIVGALIFQLLYHLLIFNKEKWKGYIEEFKNETDEQRVKGTILFYSYHVGSFLLFFFIILPLLFGGNHF